MSEAEVLGDEAATRVNRLIGVLERNRDGRSSAELHFSFALGELDAWLDDDRQWRSGQSKHWKSLLDDLGEGLSFLASLSEGGVQDELNRARAELRVLRGEFRGDEETSDESLRRRLRRLSASARAVALNPDLLLSAWRRIAVWSTEDDERADRGVAAIADLVDLHGHDGEQQLKTARSVLADSGWVIADLRGDPLPDPPTRRAGLSAHERLELADSVLVRPAPRSSGVVWLEFLQADLRWPPTLELGSAVSLYRESFLRSMIHQASSDDRIPAELRDLNGTDLPIWLDAFDPEEATRADHSVQGDPRVFLRVDLGEMPEAHLLRAARETADFLPAFASLYANNHDVWIRSKSYYILGIVSSTHAFSFDEGKARDALYHDTTATYLAEHAELLGRHLPLRDPRLSDASRLLVWLRRATGSDDPTQLILCERVIEQVCGWAGVSQPSRFVADSLRPGWVYQQMRRAIENGYWQLWQATRADHPLQDRIETQTERRQHSAGNEMPSIDLKEILDNVSELAESAPEGSAAKVGLTRLAERTSDARAASRWIDELFEDFDRRNARLRRTRNALMHGGPIVTDTVENVARFGVTLAHHAIGAATDLLLNENDLIDGFLDRQQRHERCFERLRSGTPASEALFWA